MCVKRTLNQIRGFGNVVGLDELKKKKKKKKKINSGGVIERYAR